MADIQRHSMQAEPTKEIIEKHKSIRISEFQSRKAGLKLRLHDMDNIEKKKLEVAIEELDLEIAHLKSTQQIPIIQEIPA